MDTVIAECKTCGMPTRVDFEGDQIVEIFAVCPHVKTAEELSTLSDDPVDEDYE